MRLASSPPMVMSSSSFQSASRSALSSGSSASASSRMSGSAPVEPSPGPRGSGALSSLKRRYFVASLASEPVLAVTAVSRAGLASTSGSTSCRSNSSKRPSFSSSGLGMIAKSLQADDRTSSGHSGARAACTALAAVLSTTGCPCASTAGRSAAASDTRSTIRRTAAGGSRPGPPPSCRG